MKGTTYLKLQEELCSGDYSYKDKRFGVKTMDHLFDAYLCAEFEDIQSFLDYFSLTHLKQSDFYEFVIENLEYFGVDDQALKDSCLKNPRDLITSDLNRCFGKVSKNCQPSNIVKHQKFVDIVKNVIVGKHLLDVGSGTDLPMSSLLFAKDFGKLSSMDKFRYDWQSTEIFKKFNIELIDKFFYDLTPIDSFDTIVGERPCSAIIPIVTKCADEKDKEYFIELCGCSSPQNGLSGLIEYLKEKDKNFRAFIVKKGNQQSNKYCENNSMYINDYDIVYGTNSEKSSSEILNVIKEMEERSR